MYTKYTVTMAVGASCGRVEVQRIVGVALQRMAKCITMTDERHYSIVISIITNAMIAKAQYDRNLSHLDTLHPRTESVKRTRTASYVSLICYTTLSTNILSTKTVVYNNIQGQRHQI